MAPFRSMPVSALANSPVLSRSPAVCAEVRVRLVAVRLALLAIDDVLWMVRPYDSDALLSMFKLSAVAIPLRLPSAWVPALNSSVPRLLNCSLPPSNLIVNWPPLAPMVLRAPIVVSPPRMMPFG